MRAQHRGPEQPSGPLSFPCHRFVSARIGANHLTDALSRRTSRVVTTSVRPRGQSNRRGSVDRSRIARMAGSITAPVNRSIRRLCNRRAAARLNPSPRTTGSSSRNRALGQDSAPPKTSQARCPTSAADCLKSEAVREARSAPCGASRVSSANGPWRNAARSRRESRFVRSSLHATSAARHSDRAWSRVMLSMGRINVTPPSSRRFAATPRSPAGPAPRSRAISTLSSWSSAWCAVATQLQRWVVASSVSAAYRARRAAASAFSRRCRTRTDACANGRPNRPAVASTASRSA